MIHFEISVILELLTIAGGFVLLHRANREAAPLLKVAAFILIGGGILLGLSTIFFSIQGYHRGYSGHPGMMGPGRWPMHPGGMPMDPSMMPMRPGMPGTGAPMAPGPGE
jgi:hypothetical protein